jgi:hypothetical protein
VPRFRSRESVKKSSNEQIGKLLNNKAVKDWDVDEAKATSAKILRGRFVDHGWKEKSRYCSKEFATCKGPTVFASASDVDNSSMLDLYVVTKGYPTTCFDAMAAFSHAEEQELIFLEHWAEY